jgi:diacylglycerol kinase family enzyme
MGCSRSSAAAPLARPAFPRENGGMKNVVVANPKAAAGRVRSLWDKSREAMEARLGGRASFCIGALRGLVAYNNQRVRLRVDDVFDEEIVINTVAVANGRFFGGSMMIAPHALLDDGFFDVVVLGDIGLVTFLRYSGKIYKGRHIGLPEIRELRGRVIEATPPGREPVLIDLDGEQPGSPRR